MCPLIVGVRFIECPVIGENADVTISDVLTEKVSYNKLKQLHERGGLVIISVKCFLMSLKK